MPSIMYGNYAHVDENEDDSVSVSGSFNLASLVDSNKKFKRRMGRNDGGSAFKPVRIGQSVTKCAAPPRRFLAPQPTQSNGGSADFQRKLSDVLEDGESAEKKKVDADISLSEAFLDSLKLDTPSSKTRRNATELVGEEKVSPDSGSFTMTQLDTSSHSHSQGKEETDSTVNLSGRERDRTTRAMRGTAAPVRMNFTGLVRMPQHVPEVGEEEKNKENVPYEGGGAKPKHPPVPANPTSRIRERLQQLSGSNSDMGPVRTQPNTNLNPLTNQHQPQPILNTTTTLQQNPYTTATLPPQHILSTPIPSKASIPVQQPQPTMPPPSMSLASHQQVLVVRGKRYRVMRLLGKGGSSRVYEAFDEVKNTVVAIKRVDLSDAEEAQTAGYLNEINMLVKLQSEDRIVRLHDHEKVDSEELLYVIMEKGDTDLATLLKKYSNKREITPAMIKHYWTEMLHAVSVIHKRGIIHKDLKPANFLLVAGTLKLIDFGIASSVQSDKTSVFIDNQMGTFNFMSPESIQDLNGPQYDTMGNRKPCIKISYKSDVWSLGCILYQLTYGKMPFGDIKHPLMKLQAITNVDHPIQFPILADSDPNLISVIKACLVRDARQRPSIEDLLKHSYVTGVEVAKEEEKKLLDPLSAVKMLAALEGVLSPSTFKKTSEGLTAALRKTEEESHLK